jgi:hypothetical protein
VTKRHEQELTEREFEDFLEGRSEVARGYDRLRDVEPPPALDRAVLERARAAASGPRRRPAFWSHWSSRLAVAAVVVLAVAVTLQLRPGPETIPVAMDQGAESGAAGPMTMEDAAPAAPAEAEDAPVRSVDMYARSARPPEREEAERHSAPPQQTMKRQSYVPRERAAPATRPPAEVEAMAAPLETTAAAASSDIPGATGRWELLAAYERHRAAESAAASRLGDDEAALGPTTGDRVVEPRHTPGNLSSSYSEPQTDDGGSDLSVSDELVAAKSAAQDSQASRPSLAEASGGAPQPTWREHPEDWLTLVDALLETGREAEARVELAEFVEAWPDHPLDPRYDPFLPRPAAEDAPPR